MAHIFVSHATADDDIATRIHDAVEAATGHSLWLDHIDIPPGVDWHTALQGAVRDDCAGLILLMSRSSAHRAEVIYEWNAALTYRCPILIATIDDIPAVEIPYRLMTSQSVRLYPDFAAGLRQLIDVVRDNQLFSTSPPGQGFHPSFYATTFVQQYENFEAVRNRNEQPIVEPIARENLFRVYVPLECTDGKGRINEIDVYVRDWLNRDGEGPLVILGEYGYGKTSYCLNLSYRLLQNWRLDPDATYFPVFLSFRDFVPTAERSFATSAHDKILAIFRQQYHLFEHDSDFPGALQNRKILLILDGLDEIEKSLSVEWIRRQFRSIENVTRSFAKVIITCRVSYLSDAEDVRHVMSRDQYELITGSVMQGAQLDIITLQPFHAEQKTRYVALAVKDPQKRQRLLAAIARIPDLPDLTTRPVLLWMVVSAFQTNLIDLEDSHEANAGQLYERFTRQWLESELDKDHIGRDLLTNQELMQRLALKLYRDPSEQIQRDELLRELAISFPEKSETELARLEHDFLVCSFFRPSHINHFAFVHRSFLEFFVARAYLSFIKEGRPEAFGRERLRPGLVTQFLSQLISAEKANFAREQLARWMMAARELAPAESRLAANAATVLCRLNFRFQGLDLSEVDFRDADLSRGDFRYAVLRDARLDNALLEKTKLAYSNLEGADMANVFIRETEFTGANLHGARIKNPRIVGGPDTIWVALYDRHGKNIVIGTDRGYLIVLENDGTYREVLRKLVHQSGVISIAFSRDGTKLAATNRRREIYIYDWNALMQEERQTPAIFADNANYVRSVEFSPNTPRLVSGGRDWMVKVWVVGDEPRVTSLRFHVRDVMCVTWSPDGKWLASGGYDGTIALWSADAEEPAATELRDRSLTAKRHHDVSVEKHSHDGVIRALAFSPDGSLLASSSEDRTIKLWNLTDPLSPVLDATIPTEQDVFCLAFVDAGASLVAGDSAGSLFKVNLEERLTFGAVRAHSGRIRSLALDPAGSALLSSSWDGFVKVWNISDLSLIEDVYHIEIGDIAYRPPDAFLDCNIAGVRDLEDQFRNYFIALGAVENYPRLPGGGPLQVEEPVMSTSPVMTDELFKSIREVVREELYEALCETVHQPWYSDLFGALTPGRMPEDFAHFSTLVKAGVIGSDGTARYRLNSIDHRPFVTDGLWRRGGVFPFTDESKLLLKYCHDRHISGFDELVDPGSGCGHTAIAFPGDLVRNAFDVDARAVEFARLNAWLNDRELAVVRNDITRGFPSFVAPASDRRFLFMANMPFAISPYAGALSHVSDGGENGIRLSVAVLEAARPFVGTNSRLVILTYSLGRSSDQSWQFAQRARQMLPDCRQRWTLTKGTIWRVGLDKAEPNPMPLSSLRKKGFNPARTVEEQHHLRDGYDKLAKELDSLGWDTLGCGILEVRL